MARKIQKLSRAEAVKLVAQEEPGIDFGLNESDRACSTSQLCYLRDLAPRLRGFRKRPDFPGSTGRAVYEYLARHKYDVWLIFSAYNGEPFDKDPETVYLNRQEYKTDLKAYRANSPGRHKGVHRMLTKFQINQLK